MRFDVVTIFPGMFGPVFQQGVVGRAIAGRAETAVFDANRFIVGKKEHWSDCHHAAVVSAVQVVLPLVLM